MDVDLTQNILKLWNEPQGRNAFAVYCLACLSGQIICATWLWLKKEIPCVADRFMKDPRATTVAVIANIVAIIGVAMLIPFDAIPWKAALILGLSQGFNADSALNKNTRKIWTDEERQASLEATAPGVK